MNASDHLNAYGDHIMVISMYLIIGMFFLSSKTNRKDLSASNPHLPHILSSNDPSMIGEQANKMFSKPCSTGFKSTGRVSAGRPQSLPIDRVQSKNCNRTTSKQQTQSLTANKINPNFLKLLMNSQIWKSPVNILELRLCWVKTIESLKMPVTHHLVPIAWCPKRPAETF